MDRRSALGDGAACDRNPRQIEPAGVSAAEGRARVHDRGRLAGRSAHASVPPPHGPREVREDDGTSSGVTATCRPLVASGSPSQASLGLKWTLTSAAASVGSGRRGPTVGESAVNDRTYDRRCVNDAGVSRFPLPSSSAPRGRRHPPCCTPRPTPRFSTAPVQSRSHAPPHPPDPPVDRSARSYAAWRVETARVHEQVPRRTASLDGRVGMARTDTRNPGPDAHGTPSGGGVPGLARGRARDPRGVVRWRGARRRARREAQAPRQFLHAHAGSGEGAVTARLFEVLFAVVDLIQLASASPASVFVRARCGAMRLRQALRARNLLAGYVAAESTSFASHHAMHPWKTPRGARQLPTILEPMDVSEPN